MNYLDLNNAGGTASFFDNSALREVISKSLGFKGDEGYYNTALLDMIVVERKYIPHYSLEIPEFWLSDKVQYTRMLIDNSVITTLNEYVREFSKYDSRMRPSVADAYQYVHQLISHLLTELRANWRIDFIEFSALFNLGRNFSAPEDRNKAEEHFIVHYLAYSLILLGLEFDALASQYFTNEEGWSIGRYFLKCLMQNAPVDNFIREIWPQPLIQQKSASLPILERPNRQAANPAEYLSFQPLNLREGEMGYCLNTLKESKYVDVSVSLTDWKKIFTYQKITNPAIWTGNIKSLVYFIKELFRNQVVFHPKKWVATCTCFIGKGGKVFSPRNLSYNKELPATTIVLDKCVNHMKKLHT